MFLSLPLVGRVDANAMSVGVGVIRMERCKPPPGASFAMLSMRHPPHALRGRDYSHHRLHTRQRLHEVAKGRAANLEIAVLVERRTGRRQQHDRVSKT